LNIFDCFIVIRAIDLTDVQELEMKVSGLVASTLLTIGLLAASTTASAHEPGSGYAAEGFIVTRHFTGIWDQVDQEAQGLALQVIEQLDDSRTSVVYWYTYDADRKTAWFVGVGALIDNRIDFELFESTDVGFMQDAVSGNDSVQSIGTMTIVFDSCDSGVVTYETDNVEVGSGTFKIERLLEVMNTHCTGGISDDMHADGLFGEQRLELTPARIGITGNGLARYEDYPAHMEFEVEVAGMPDGGYSLFVGMRDRGVFVVSGGRGEIQFSSPAEDGHRLLNFDPRGMRIEVRDNQGTALSSFNDMFEEDDHRHHGYGYGDGHEGDDDHINDCEPGTWPGHGPGMGGGMTDCADG
jgi:hypothetical protein